MLTTSQIQQARSSIGLGTTPKAPSVDPKTLSGNDLSQHYLSLAPKTPTSSTSGGYLNDVKTGLKGAADEMSNNFQTSGKNIYNDISKAKNDFKSMQAPSVGNAVRQVATVGKLAGQVGGEISKNVLGDFGVAGKALGAYIPKGISNAVHPIVDAAKNAITKTGQSLYNVAPKLFDAYVNLPPEIQESVGNLVNATMVSGLDKSLPEKLSVKGGIDTAVNTATDMAGTAKAGLNEVKNIATDVKNLAPSSLRPSELLKSARSYIDRKYAPENLGSSVDRLNTGEDALKKYNQFYDQEQKYKTDIKQPTALEQVGKDTGDAYDQVIEIRRDTGTRLGEEVKAIKNLPTDISEQIPQFEEELSNNGLKYDAQKGTISGSKLSKVSAQDKILLQKYASDLKGLGENPTAGELDAFLSRVPKELKVFKETNNVTNVTNGERIITSNLNALDEALSPKANPNFSNYAIAKEDYAQLSDVLDEGSNYLGKKLPSGEYAKDVSLAKNSVQSILQGGKKDYLLKLEDLTGTNIVDKTMLALQAMKDSGNFKGNTLMELLTPKEMGGVSDIPTSSESLMKTITNKALQVGKDKFLGSPADQTRQFIMDRIGASQETAPFSPISATGKAIKGGIDALNATPNKEGGFVNFGTPIKDEPNLGGLDMTDQAAPNDSDFGYKPKEVVPGLDQVPKSANTSVERATRVGNEIATPKTEVSPDVTQLENTSFLDKGRKYGASIEGASEQAGGWQPGMKEMFDTALHSGDKMLVKALIRADAIPVKYKELFASEIANIIK